MNLFDNALKYCDIDTLITVDIHPQKATGNLIIDVCNTGVGFTTEESADLFSRGYRGKEAAKIKASGSGIGLYICQNILDVAFSATIEAVYASKARLVTFRVRFPSFTLDKQKTEERRDAKESKGER